ncbi:MAG: MBL fold metallo-hydrolase [Candidatus Eremiobacteraeota bacterium]|nr:MBL fold metallo-hydrolase [Candidatus Eremiobacteraeota bacterium]
MKIKFWGTRGSIPSPGSSTIKYGGNTPCVEVHGGGALVIIDCGSGLRALGNALLAGKKPVKASILLSHTHWDHIQGFPFFKPGFIPGNEFTLYGPHDTGACIQKVMEGQMEHRYFPVKLSDMGSKVRFQELKEGPFSIGGMAIDVQYMNHTALTMGFRITEGKVSICYCTDTEPHSLLTEEHAGGEGSLPIFAHKGDQRLVDFIRNAEMLIIDSQYTGEEYATKKGWGHSSIDYAVMVALQGNVRRLALFHHDPEHSDEQIDGFVEYGRELAARWGRKIEIFAAREEQELEIGEA